jgi:mono/diheme cytochrome c family protein
VSGVDRRTSAPARHSTLFVLAVIVAGALVLISGQVGSGATAMTHRASAGSPGRGREVFLAKGCSGCHALGDPGSRQPAGPTLTPELLRSSAAAAGKPIGPFTVDSLLVPNAFTSPGYVSNIMPPTKGLSKQQLDDLVSFLIGAPYTSPSQGVQTPANPVAACKADSTCRSTVTLWARSESLPPGALDGARIVAKVGCLSCHRYAGSGTASGSAPDLTRIGRRAVSTARLLKQLTCPDCVSKSSAMPSFAALGKQNLARVTSFLRASRGTKR